MITDVSKLSEDNDCFITTYKGEKIFADYVMTYNKNKIDEKWSANNVICLFLYVTGKIEYKSILIKEYDTVTEKILSEENQDFTNVFIFNSDFEKVRDYHLMNRYI